MNTHSIDLELSSSQYLSRADTASLSITGDISLEAWIKLEQLPSVAGTTFEILAKYSYNGGEQRSYEMLLDNTDKLHVVYYSGGGVVCRRVSTNAIVTSGDVGNWVHLAGVIDVSEQDGTLYRNGSSVASSNTQTGATSILDSTAPFFIGATQLSGAITSYFDGLIDEVRVWNDIRTAGEISTNYQTELVGSEGNLQGYWKLNNDALDSTANANNLTLYNSPVYSTSVPFPVRGFMTTNSKYWG